MTDCTYYCVGRQVFPISRPFASNGKHLRHCRRSEADDFLSAWFVVLRRSSGQNQGVAFLGYLPVPAYWENRGKSFCQDDMKVKGRAAAKPLMAA